MVKASRFNFHTQTGRQKRSACVSTSATDAQFAVKHCALTAGKHLCNLTCEDKHDASCMRSCQQLCCNFTHVIANHPNITPQIQKQAMLRRTERDPRQRRGSASSSMAHCHRQALLQKRQGHTAEGFYARLGGGVLLKQSSKRCGPSSPSRRPPLRFINPALRI